jgi:siderophore synthetase component
VPVSESATRVDLDQQHGGAAAAILARVWGAFAREPVPGVTHRGVENGRLTVNISALVVSGDASTARPFALPAAGFSLAVAAPGQPSHEVHEPGELVRALATALGPNAPRLADELDDSVANLALARAAQSAPDGGPPMLDRAIRQPDPLAFLEQSVVDGHPLHPCARTRMGLSPDEVRAYAPEHHPIVRLRRVVVPPDRWFGINHGPALVLHPYQHDRLRHEYPWLSDVDSEIPARPLLSLRTLALVDQPDRHLKTAVDIQMTSAVRTVTPASIHNGSTLSSLLLDERMRVPGIEVLPETGGGAVIVDGEPDKRLAMLSRRVPPLHHGEVALPFAALAAPSQATGAPLVDEIVESGYGGDPGAFVEALARVLLTPVFALLERGVALEAHGQNLLGVVRGHRLVGLRYRDFGGVRVSAARLRAWGVQPPQLRGDVPCDEPEVLRTKVFASAVSTVLGQVIALLDLPEEQAWQRVAAVAKTLPGPDAPRLFDATLPVKATTAMRLAERPIDDIWCTLPNPLAGLG